MSESVRRLDNRLIAYLDVLGFSSLLENNALDYVHSKYARFIDEAKSQTFFEVAGDNTGRTNFEYAQFLYDSLVLVSNPIDDVYAVNSFIAAIHFLLEVGFRSKLPLRGAISKGDFLVDEIRGVFLSSCFPQVVRFEAQQEWSGCVVLEDAEELVVNAVFGARRLGHLKNAVPLRNDALHYYPIPHKKKDFRFCLSINFLFFLTEQQILDGIKHFTEPKKTNMQIYFDFLESLPCLKQKLGNEFYPAVELKLITTRTGMRACFLDESNNPCEPAAKNFSWVAIGRWKD